MLHRNDLNNDGAQGLLENGELKKSDAVVDNIYY